MVDSCPECQRLSRAYEAATLEWFRLQGQHRIAEYSGATVELDAIFADLKAVAKRRQVLRDAEKEHVLTSHNIASGASS